MTCTGVCANLLIYSGEGQGLSYCVIHACIINWQVMCLLNLNSLSEDIQIIILYSKTLYLCFHDGTSLSLSTEQCVVNICGISTCMYSL